MCDQLVDRTHGRADTYFDGPVVNHVSFADPYCPELRGVALAACEAEDVTVHADGTIVVVQGPRFSTRAESRWYRAAGWDVIGMTQYPEAYLARELGLCYATIALVTDYDTGVEDDPSIGPGEPRRGVRGHGGERRHGCARCCSGRSATCRRARAACGCAAATNGIEPVL